MRRSSVVLAVAWLVLAAAACASIVSFPDVPNLVEGGVDANVPHKEASEGVEDSPAAVCEAGESRCSGSSAVQTCLSGAWGMPAACDNQVCDAGRCSGVCSPGTTRCASSTQVATCGTNGQWGVATTCSKACAGTVGMVGGNCGGMCTPNAKQCSGNGVQTCGSQGQWGSAVACSDPTPYCANGACLGPNCVPAGPGTTNCGASAESCCASPSVPGGTYYRTYQQGGSEGGVTGTDPASVSAFRMDKYEVTVGRFRQFVIGWSGGTGWLPPAGAGKHTHLNGGMGLSEGGSPGTYEPGWVASDDSNVAPTNANLACHPAYATWTPSAGNSETLPITCVNWFEAYAFCIWDGGFLPSEAEWEYVAAGGAQYRDYPWGSTSPGTSNRYAIYGCQYPTGSGSCTGLTNIAPVGTATLGAGLWGQLDLAGEIWEWNLDWYASSYVDPCTDCADLSGGPYRVFRGGSYYYTSSGLSPQFRDDDVPAGRYYGVGFRCARSP
jgi:sulfatase modifying factor 1